MRDGERESESSPGWPEQELKQGERGGLTGRKQSSEVSACEHRVPKSWGAEQVIAKGWRSPSPLPRSSLPASPGQ